MNILVIGSGAREHILLKTLAQSSSESTLFCCATSIHPGIVQWADTYALTDITDVEAVLARALEWEISLAIIGPEAPLEKGLSDIFSHHGILTIGPKQKSSRIETSKVFARELCQKHKIPGTPTYQFFSDLTHVRPFLHELGNGNFVVKADGLMGGKGVKVAGEHLHSLEEAFQFCQELHAKGFSFLIEEKLIGQEFSMLNFCDGTRLIPMPLVQDHKRAFVGDTGPNTGGMGSYSDANHRLPFLLDSDIEAAQQINEAVIVALRTECEEEYRGILYGSFIATQKGVYIIEYNARFGDPEVLNILSILDCDFVQLCDALARGSLFPEQVRFKPLATVCKYAVPFGYPDSSLVKTPVSIEKVHNPENLYFAGVQMSQDQLYATGSRTIAAVGIASTLTEAEAIAESEVSRIEGALFHREDLGKPHLISHRIHMMEKLRERTSL